MSLRILGALALFLPLVCAESSFTVPVTYYKLPNGLRVALSPDHTALTVAVAVYYKIGFRVEPKDRTGFAHDVSGLAEPRQDGINSSRAGVIGQLRFVDLQLLGDDWLRNYVPSVLKVSPAEVHASRRSTWPEQDGFNDRR